jgi:hypothetical protein
MIADNRQVVYLTPLGRAFMKECRLPEARDAALGAGDAG